MRKQYHFRPSERGLLAWDVDKLVQQTENLPIEAVDLAEIRELDTPYWFGDEVPTSRKVAEHAQLIHEADLAYPIILDPEGGLMDGMHRVCKAWMQGHKSIAGVRLKNMPEPDYVGCDPKDLAYD